LSPQVFHGDLAARNVLLADSGVVKVADFGMARKMYYEDDYKKSGQVQCKNINHIIPEKQLRLKTVFNF
jgi:serine/threonine protein kinase